MELSDHSATSPRSLMSILPIRVVLEAGSEKAREREGRGREGRGAKESKEWRERGGHHGYGRIDII